jgi:hypothetical protein
MPRNEELQKYRNEEFHAIKRDLTVNASEINTLDGITSTVGELNKLDGFSPLSFINTGDAVTAKTDNYTAVLADANTCLNFGTASSKTFTIPANTVVAFPVGTVFLIAKSTNALTLAVTTDTHLGSTTVAASTGAIIVKVASTTWLTITSA